MNLSEINWDINAAGTWPFPVKVAATLILCAVVALGGIYWDTLDQLDSLDVVKKKEQELKATFELKQKKAVNLKDYQKQLSDIESSLEVMVRQMPTEEEVASLLSVHHVQCRLREPLDDRSRRTYFPSCTV